MQIHIFETDFSLRLVETLLHFLWQGFAIGLVMRVLNAFVPQTRSNLRYRLNLFALLLMAACLPLTFALLSDYPSKSVPAGESVAALVSNTSPSTEKGPVLLESTAPKLDPTPEVSPQSPGVESGSNEADPRPVSSRSTPDIEVANIVDTSSSPWINRIAPYATTIYVTGVVLMLLRLLLAVWGGQRLRRVALAIDEPGLLANVEQIAHRLGLKLAPIVATCSRISVPMVVGIVKPMILLPPALVTGMSPDQLEAVLAHELAHLRRFDLVINLLQRLIEAVLFFHPAMWYVSRRVSIEREHRCDDTVMGNGCSRLTYADALLRMAEICTGTAGQPALESATALAATGHNSSEFKRRVLRVVGETNGPPLRLTRGGVAIFTAILISIMALPWAVQSRAEEEKSQVPDVAALDLSGPITDSKFIDAVAEQVGRLPFVTDWQLENARQFARQITLENLSSDISEEERRRILESLNDYVSAFRKRHRGENRDNSYVRRPEDVRNLLWRLKLALNHKPLDDQEKAKLDAQMEELFKWVRTVPPHSMSELTSDEVTFRLKERQADSMEPLFKHPLPKNEFDEMMTNLGNLDLSLVHADPHVVWEWLNAEVRSNPDMVTLTGNSEEKNTSYGQHGGHVHVGYKSTNVWLGNRNGTDAWSTFIDFSEAVPGIRSLDPPRSVIERGDDAIREWVEESSYTNLGHITFDYEKRRLVGVRGTRLLELDVDSFIAADQLNGDVLKDRIRKQGRGEFSLPKPKSIDDLGHDETYDLFVGALTKEHNLYVLKIETVGTLSKMLWYRVRRHNPPYPDEIKIVEDHGSHDHDHAELTTEGQMKAVIGRFDADYGKTVDIPRLIADKHIDFSPDREVLALLRGQTLYAIEATSGRYQEFQVTEKASLVEWKSGSIHVRTQGGEDRFFAVRRPTIQFVDSNDDPVSEGRLMEARIGWATPPSNWLMYWHKPKQPMSLMGLKPGTHWLVTDSRDLFAVTMPLGTRDPNLPQEVTLQGEVTERKSPSGTVREVPRHLQPQPTFQAENVSATALVRPLPNGRELLLVAIRNNSGKPLQLTEQHIFLETEERGKFERALSPDWTHGDSESKWPQMTIENGATGVLELDWNRWRDRGVWFSGFPVALDEKGLGPVVQIPGRLPVRVSGPGFRTRPVALSTGETEPPEKQPAATRNLPTNTGVKAPPGNPTPQPFDATTLELYNRYIAKVGKIESASIAAAIELVAARASGDPEFTKLLRKDFSTSHQEENQRYDSRKLLTLITEMLYREGSMRWQLEEEKRTGAPGQRALPPGDFLYRESPLLSDVIKYGRKCGRSEIDDFAFAVRQAHHPQGKQFLLDVLQNPSDTGNPFDGTDITKGNWTDNVGGGWEEARFLAAVGLAELGVEEGVRWLIEHARPNDFGEGGTIWHHRHIRSKTDSMQQNCEVVLYDLSGLQHQEQSPPTDWDEWWGASKKSFSPRPVALKESVGY